MAMKLTYGAIEGSQRLREAIASLYKSVSPSRFGHARRHRRKRSDLTGVIEQGEPCCHLAADLPAALFHS
jgi:hypothetical protein